MPPTLLTLPTEIKVTIVQMISWQEDAWLLRKGHSTRESRKAARAASGGGLGAVALVCKEFNQIAAQFLFQSVSAARMTPLFLHRVSHRHSHLITHVEITSDDNREHESEGAVYDCALHLLPSLPNLRALTLDARAARVMFGEDWFDSGAAPGPGTIESFKMDTVKGVSHRVDDLTLVRFSPTEVAKVLSLWTDLRRLRLTELRDEGYHELEGLGPLEGALSKLQELRHLEIDSLATSDDDGGFVNAYWPDDDFDILRNHPPPLTSLEISGESFDDSQFAFIASFHATLKHLSIMTTEDDPHHDSYRAHLPLLQSLHIHVQSIRTKPSSKDVSRQLLLPFLLSPIVTLTIFDSRSNFHQSELFASLKGHLPLLRHLHIDSPLSLLPLPTYRELQAACTDRDIPFPSQSFFDYNRLEEYTRLGFNDRADAEVVRTELEGVLEFGKRRIDWGHKLDEGAGNMKELLEAMRPLNELMKAWED